MCLVDDDGEALATMLIADLVEDHRELLHRGDDDLLARLQELAQRAGPIGMSDDRCHLSELLDRVPDLLVEQPPIGHDDCGVECQAPRMLQTDQLMREPGDGVALAAAGRVLDQVAPPDTVTPGVAQQFPHDVELMVAGEHLARRLLLAVLVPLLDDLSEVLQDLGQARLGQHVAPQVVGLQPGSVGRIPGSIVPALVEGQEPRLLPLQMGAHPNLGIVHGEVDDAAPELEQRLPRIAVALELFDRVRDGLLRQAVLELEGGNRQSVDEGRHVERLRAAILGVAQLPRDAEDVGGVQLDSLGIHGRGRAEEQLHGDRAVLHPAAKHVDHAALRNFALKAMEKLEALGLILQPKLRDRLGLCGLEERQELRHIHRVVAVVALGVAEHIAGVIDQRSRDERFEALLAGVGTHAAGVVTRPGSQP